MSEIKAPTERREQRDRAEDKGWLCAVALRASQFWDFVDRRQLDAYAVSFAIILGTMKITNWAMDFVDTHPDMDGLKAAAIIGAIMLPWSALQAAAIKFLFDARATNFETRRASSREHSITDTNSQTRSTTDSDGGKK